MIHLQCTKWVRMAIMHFNITQKRLNWVMWERTINFQLCICMGKVLRLMRKKKFIIWNRLQLVVTYPTIEIGENSRFERAAKHFFIGANLGCDDSMEHLTLLYTRGYVKKDDLALDLRGHQATVDATKSPQREEGEGREYLF